MPTTSYHKRNGNVHEKGKKSLRPDVCVRTESDEPADAGTARCRREPENCQISPVRPFGLLLLIKRENRFIV